jgi:hypothetical protein
MSSSNYENSRSSAEVEHLTMLEAIVRRGLDADLEVGNALAEINDTWLYRATHDTFDAYVRDRWGMSPTLAHELIQAAEAAAPPSTVVDSAAPAMRSQAGPLAPVRRDGTDRLAKVWEKARHEFGGDDVSAVEIHLTIHKRQQPPAPKPNPWPSHQAPNQSMADEPLRRLRWLMAEASGTIANIAHQLETHASKLDDYAREQLLDDVLVLDEDLDVLRGLLPATVDWDAAHGRLIAGEIPPFDDESDDEDEDD